MAKLINPDARNNSASRYTVAVCFTPGISHVLEIYANHIDGAFEALGEYAETEMPGLLCEDAERGYTTDGGVCLDLDFVKVRGTVALPKVPTCRECGNYLESAGAVSGVRWLSCCE